jgi:two-component system nitrate/nitrite sensor histidine kinase NarX
VGDAAFTDCHSGSYNLRFPLVQDGLNFGVLVARVTYDTALQEWQHNLIQSVADQISMALSLDNRGEQERRVSLLNERTIIARELHDSLAQSLSYLKIQVTRLQKAHDKGVSEVMFQELMTELREGLGSAYRQLRELLSTFRLQIDGSGLKGALEDSISQLRQRSDMEIELNYQIDVVPLSPNEEIHLLQVVKESLHNAVHHSKGSKVSVELVIENNEIKLSVCDDGAGIPDDPEKLNHYGLAIMKERSRHLNGALHFARQEEGGTCVKMCFAPEGLAS